MFIGTEAVDAKKRKEKSRPVIVSREATIIESVSSSEVYVEAVGIYNSTEKRRRRRKKDVKIYGKGYAIEDAKRAAVHYLIFNGTDPLVSRPDEIERFNAIQESFFKDETVNEIVVYVEPTPHKIVSLDNGEGIKVYINMKLNLSYLRQVLEENLVVFSREELVEELGYPQIMVIPRSSGSQSPVDILKTDKTAQHAAGVIESFLTSKQYDVVIPDQLQAVTELAQSIKTIKGLKKDDVYELALQIGSDIYLDYTVNEADSAYDTEQISVTVRAYETTTAKLLASETGYSKPRVGEKFVSIEEALLGSLRNVTQRIIKYWEDDLYKGAQYKVIAHIKNDDLSEDKREDVMDDYLDTIEDISLHSRENVSTDITFDYIVWCDHEEFGSSRHLYKAIQKEFGKKQRKLEVRLTNRNRKLLLLEIR